MLRRILMMSFPMVLVASLAFGQSVSKPRENREVVEMVKVSHPTSVNGTTIQPAKYRMVAKGDELKVEDLKHNVIAVAPITWKHSDHRFTSTKMDIDHGVLTKVNLGNTNMAVLLHNSSASAR